MRSWRSATALAVGLMLGASAVAVAADTPTQYTGCLTKDGAIVKVAVGSAPKLACSKTETLINWNAQGPEGPMGPAGPAGEPGLPGQDGAPGVTLTEMSMAAGDEYVYFEYGAYDVGVGCPTGQPTFTWEGDTHDSYTEAGGTVSFATSSNGFETLGPSNPKVTFVILDPTIGVKSFTLWAVSCSDMVFSQSPGN